jgi:hypothetical protein
MSKIRQAICAAADPLPASGQNDLGRQVFS